MLQWNHKWSFHLQEQLGSVLQHPILPVCTCLTYTKTASAGQRPGLRVLVLRPRRSCPTTRPAPPGPLGRWMKTELTRLCWWYRDTLIICTDHYFIQFWISILTIKSFHADKAPQNQQGSARTDTTPGLWPDTSETIFSPPTLENEMRFLCLQKGNS